MTAVLAPPRRRVLLVTALVLLAAATRLAYLLSPAMQFNADEATTGIMVRRILAGHGYVYYAGQAYGGALEQYVEALVYAVTRLPQNELTLRLPLVALCMGTCVLVHRVAGDVFDDPVRPLVAAGLYAVSPWFNVIGTVTSLGFYAVGQTLSVAALWCALRSGRGPRWLVATGLCAGLGMWTAATALYVLIPVFLWLVPVLGRDARRWGLTAAGFVLGALPMLVDLAVHRTLPLPPDPAQPTTVPERVGNLFGPILRQYVGVTYAHDEGGLWLPVQLAVVAGLVVAYLVALVRRRGLADLLRGRVAARRPGDLLLAVPPVVLVLWAASDATWYTGTPRYLVGTFPLLAIGLAALVPTRPPVVPVVAVVACAALAFGFFPTIRSSHTREGDAVLRQVTTVLVAEHHTDVYAGYWTAMPLQYVAGDRLVVATAIGVRRFPDAQDAVERAPEPVWVGSDHDGTTAVIRAALDRSGLPYRARRFAFLTVFDQLPASADPDALGF
ncbi:MAG TPA: glycosyltransferase family 39 protein [Mycobacteriales bacterium]|nr:glycosyltransferase family 39 protein [Mycobacteriales bacterium]